MRRISLLCMLLVVLCFNAYPAASDPGEMIYIPTDSFLMGNSNVGNDGKYHYSEELPQHSVTLSGYWIGKYEVTRGQYRAFMNAGGYSNSSYWSTAGWSWKVSNNRTEPYDWAANQDWGSGTFTQTDNHPVVGVNYYEAEAFCNWAGGHLPTEAQWERAARWTGTHANVYPWGDVWDAEKCNNWRDHNVAGGGYQRGRTAPVGSYPSGASPSGCQDMAGNVWEWCQDLYKSYPGSSSPSDYTNSFRVLRGGGFYNEGNEGSGARCASRNVVPRGYGSGANSGFRLARGGNPITSEANKPVVLLVRGLRPTGGQESPYSYWEAAYDYLDENVSDAIICAVGNDVFDGTGTIEEAGGKLKKFIEDNYPNKDIYIVAHSMGGLVTRSCLYQMSAAHRKWVKKVVMLSTPNCGTRVADVVAAIAKVAEFGWAGRELAAITYGFELSDARRCNSLRDLRTGTVLDYCRKWNDAGGKYYLIGGTSNVSPLLSRKLGALVLTGNENDCLVTKKSAWGQNGSGGYMLPSAAIRDFNLNHDEMITNAGLLKNVASILLNTYRLSGGASYASMPAQLSSVMSSGSAVAVILDIHSDSISNGETKDFDVPVDQLSEVTFSLDYPSGGPTFTLVQPDSVVITPTAPGTAIYESGSESGVGHASYTIPNPNLGHWKLRVTGTNLDSGTGYALNASATGMLTLASTTTRVQLNSSCFIKAALDDSGSAVTGATVTADCLNPDSTSTAVTLLDDGLHGDEAANDGVYGGQLTSPTVGNYTALLKATGAYSGNDYARLESASFTVSPATATLNDQYSVLGVDEGGSIGYEKLRVNVGLNVVSGSSFRVYGELADQSGNTITAAVSERTDLVVDDNTIALDFDGDAIRRSGATGTFKLTGVVVTDTSFDPELAILEDQDVYSFSGFSGSDFVDITPPAYVNDLTVASVTDNSITLTWNAPDSEGSSAASYELRWSNDGFSTASWTEGTIVSNVPTPATPGVQQTITVSGIAPGKYYWFCIRSRDGKGNLSELSNLPVTYYTGQPPAIISLAPNSGSIAPSVKQTFASVYSDRDGYSDLAQCYLLINTTRSGTNAVYAMYDANTNLLYLRNDANASWGTGYALGSANTLQNNQCKLYCAETTKSGSGNNLTVNWKIEFKPAMSNKSNKAWLSASDDEELSSTWIAKGEFGVFVAAPTLTSVSPASGTVKTGAWKTFACVYSDPNGATDLAMCELLVNATASNNGGARLMYSRSANKFYMRNNAGVLTAGVTRGAAGTLQSENAILDCAGTTVSWSGNNLTVKWKVQFKSAMAGKNCNLYMQASDVSSAIKTWTDKGDCNINGSPTLVSVSPASGTVAVGAWKTFTCVYSDPNGASDLSKCYLLANTSATYSGGAYFFYDRILDKFYMKNNAGTQIGGTVRGTAGTIETENAILDCGATTVTTSGNNLTIAWKVQIKPVMAGKKCNLYMNASDAYVGTGWIDKGDCIINAPPTLTSISPASGTVQPGVWKTFTAVYSDIDGAADLTKCRLLINNTIASAGGAYFVYDRTTNKLYMNNNAGQQIGGILRGTATTIQSENAILDCAGTTVSWSGNNLTVKWKVQFKSAMAGKNCNLFMQASDALGAVKTWTSKGTVTVATNTTYTGQMINIPAGSFLMGNNGSELYSQPNELPQHSVTLSAYSIGKYEVTRGEYKKFINAGGYSTQSFWSTDGWSWKVSNSRTEPYYWAASQNWGTGTFTQTDNHPVVGVCYYEAEAFCNWAGGHLPTEAQWERAARWTGTHANVYPWGDVWDAEKCNNYFDHNVAGGGISRRQTAPVGSYSSYPSPSGCQDMAGNVCEWCLDWYKSYPGSSSPFDYTNSYRVPRGGGWYYGNSDYRCAYRYNYDLYIYGDSLGFRLAR